MHEDLLSALADGPGLILVVGPTGSGKTTAIEQVIADPRCPRDTVFVGDLRGDVEDVRHAVQLARSRVVVGVLRISRAADAFARLIDVGVSARDVCDVARVVFSARLVRTRGSDALLLHERLVVTDALRALIGAHAEPDAIHRQAIADGMRSLREVGLELVRAGRVDHASMIGVTPGDKL